MVAIFNPPPVAGAPAIGTVSGAAAIYPPHWTIPLATSGTFATTATRIYYIPYYFPEKVSYTGLKMRNLGAGDNGEVLRLGVYTKSSTTNLPATLVVDAGEITLTGAAADRTLATAFTPAYIGWHYLAYHANTGADIMGMATAYMISSAGAVMPHPYLNPLGTVTTNLNLMAGTAVQGGAVALYINTAYGALASTAVTPTALIDTAPYVAPYRT